MAAVGLPNVERSSLGAAARTGVVVPAGRPRDGRGARRADRHRHHRRALRRPPDRVPVRRPEHAPRGGPDLQRLRAPRLLRAGRRGLPGRGRRGRPRGDRLAADAAVSRGAAGAAGPDRGRARLGGAPAAPLPGRLRLDRAAAVRPHHHRRARRRARTHDRARPAGPDALARARAGGHRGGHPGRAQSRGAPSAFVAARNVERVIDPSLVAPGGHAGLDAGYLGILPDDAVPVLVGALPALPASANARGARRPLEERKVELARDPAFASPAAWNLGRERAREALATLP